MNTATIGGEINTYCFCVRCETGLAHTHDLWFQHGSRPSKNIGSAVHVNAVVREAKVQIKLLAHVTKHIPHSGQIADREAAVNCHSAQLG